jgi:hypothetical protein
VDFQAFKKYLNKYLKLFRFRLHAFCLLSNHFHLLLENTDIPALSEFMRRLLTAYTVYYNRRQERHGHLFQGRFKSLIVDKTEYLISLSRYIHLNPDPASKSVDLESYEGSSLRYYVKGREPAWLYTKEILSWFNGDRMKYAQYVREDLNQEITWTVHSQRFIGGKDFVQRIKNRLQSKIGDKALPNHEDIEIERSARIIDMVAKHFGVNGNKIKVARSARGSMKKARQAAIFLFREHLPWPLWKIATHLNLKNQDTVLYHLRMIEKDKEILRDMSILSEMASNIQIYSVD